jgi:hypothetical protein
LRGGRGRRDKGQGQQKDGAGPSQANAAERKRRQKEQKRLRRSEDNRELNKWQGVGGFQARHGLSFTDPTGARRTGNPASPYIVCPNSCPYLSGRCARDFCSLNALKFRTINVENTACSRLPALWTKNTCYLSGECPYCGLIIAIRVRAG